MRQVCWVPLRGTPPLPQTAYEGVKSRIATATVSRARLRLAHSAPRRSCCEKYCRALSTARVFCFSSPVAADLHSALLLAHKHQSLVRPGGRCAQTSLSVPRMMVCFQTFRCIRQRVAQTRLSESPLQDDGRL